MIAVDTNILVYAHRRDSQWHAAAYSCIAKLAESGALWGVPWPCIHEFLAVVTHPSIYHPPTTAAKAIEQVEIWREVAVAAHPGGNGRPLEGIEEHRLRRPDGGRRGPRRPHRGDLRGTRSARALVRGSRFYAGAQVGGAESAGGLIPMLTERVERAANGLLPARRNEKRRDPHLR